MNVYCRSFGVGILASAIGAGEQVSLAQSPVPPVNLTTCAPVFHYRDQRADQARSLIVACAKHCKEILDPTPKREDPMFNTCEEARLNPDPRRPSWYMV